jgi:predicted phosphodiesterase
MGGGGGMRADGTMPNRLDDDGTPSPLYIATRWVYADTVCQLASSACDGPRQERPKYMIPPKPSSVAPHGKLFGVSDLHVTHPDNRRIVEDIWPQSPADWLLVCGDVSESPADMEWALSLLKARFSTIVWVPGNHDLWTMPEDGCNLRGERRYQHLVGICRRTEVFTPEDDYPIWGGSGGPIRIAPLFLLYDYTFGQNIAPTKQESLALAHEAGIVSSDEFVLYPDPYSSKEAWCDARVSETELRLAACDDQMPTILVSHFPLIHEVTLALRYPEFAQWCGTKRTADWHRRFRATAVVYGHLHIPRTTWHDGVRFEEVSLGYPREWQARGHARDVLRQILPVEET